jgi:hypothetical protein
VDGQDDQAWREELIRMTQELIGLARRLLAHYERMGSPEVGPQRDRLERLMEMLLRLKGDDPLTPIFLLF